MNGTNQIDLFPEEEGRNSPVSTLSPAGSHNHARISPSPAREQESQDHVLDYGPTCTELLAKYDQDSHSWRTSQRCLLEGWAELSETWPKSGMTRSGKLYLRPQLARTTRETERTFLPTLGANEGKGSSHKRFRNSEHFRGAKMAEGLRTCHEDPIYTNPDFAGAQMGYPKKWAHMAIQSARKLQK